MASTKQSSSENSRSRASLRSVVKFAMPLWRGIWLPSIAILRQIPLDIVFRLSGVRAGEKSATGLASAREDPLLLRRCNRAVPLPTHVLHRRRDRHIVELDRLRFRKAPGSDAKGSRFGVRSGGYAAENHLLVVKVNPNLVRKVDDIADRRFVPDPLPCILCGIRHETVLVTAWIRSFPYDPVPLSSRWVHGLVALDRTRSPAISRKRRAAERTCFRLSGAS